MKLVETRKIETGKVRAMCIKNDYYTYGTNEEYSKMFEMCNMNCDILEIATDILKHSYKIGFFEQKGYTEKEVLENICYQLINDCSYTCVEIKD